MKIKRFFAIMMIAAMFAVTISSVAMMAGTTIVVTPPINSQGWSTADTRPGGAVNFVADPSAPGDGALQLTTDATNASKAQYLHGANAPLIDVTELSYSTRQVSGPPHADPSYQLLVCLTGATNGVCNQGLPGTTHSSGESFTTFVYEPYQKDGVPSGAVIPNVWQNWDVDEGKFWSSRTVACSNGTIFAGAGGPPFYSLAQINSICPGALATGFGVNIGSFNPGYNVYADLINFNGTTYDFEPDTDSDGIGDGYDNCPTTANADQADGDGDGIGNACDPDNDNDGVNDNVDNCPAVANPNQADGDGDGIGNACDPNLNDGPTGDLDGDGDLNNADNCLTTSNADQLDTDGDGFGNACDGDDDGDGVGDGTDNCPLNANANQADFDGDGIGDACETGPVRPTNKDQCKDGGWMNWTPRFKNQGDCIQFVNTGR